VCGVRHVFSSVPTCGRIHTFLDTRTKPVKKIGRFIKDRQVHKNSVFETKSVTAEKTREPKNECLRTDAEGGVWT
jgi:hypothetical protein